jgi:polysaccharide export outer membrane protein
VILRNSFHFFQNRLAGSAAAFRVLFIVAVIVCPRPSFAQSPGGMSSLAQARSGGASSSASMMGVTDEPIFSGETVAITVSNAPDFSTVARVSMGGDVPVPYLGIVHFAGLNSASASALIEKMLMDSNLVIHPNVLVTVDGASTGITVLGEVRTPGIYTPMGKHMLSDILAMAGGVTTTAGRIIEISSDSAPDQKTLIPWDPTLHNTDVFDRVMRGGSRVVVKPCGVVYVGGNVTRPGAYPLCASRVATVSQLIALASNSLITSKRGHTLLIRTLPDGSRVVQQLDLAKIQNAKAADPAVREDDMIYVPVSGVKYTLINLLNYFTEFGVATLDLYAR